MAVHTWGSLWQRQMILFHCDNQVVVSIWKAGSKETIALVCLLYYYREAWKIFPLSSQMNAWCNWNKTAGFASIKDSNQEI